MFRATILNFTKIVCVIHFRDLSYNFICSIPVFNEKINSSKFKNVKYE